ncbi:uncharacterized protein RHIMIDRAFT_262112 [Rhizopus microsporus ATCC 52813]|uniref:Uncharacterized protein n=1 Tax=Rhizopus microsporus ATCC 52813 TaxID=1340429 RepID=A0A2G4SLL3_RHIZD|nr:uncharacterized protein RHIMIDRAFT_262112 [Rhizopus microsporus ATCC 52813]PHZ09665.1 hypothetical protein RHIMIDRAFT_262112 [Rhizopus microsporus ATCC 52813]
MITISREQAICMFYCQPYNESNASKLSKLIDNMDNIEICYSDDPTEPMLISLQSLHTNSFKYHQYPAFLDNCKRDKSSNQAKR